MTFYKSKTFLCLTSIWFKLNDDDPSEICILIIWNLKNQLYLILGQQSNRIKNKSHSIVQVIKYGKFQHQQIIKCDLLENYKVQIACADYNIDFKLNLFKSYQTLRAQQNDRIRQMNQNGAQILSQIKLKRENFHKEIRSQFKNDLFSTKRRQLYMYQLTITQSSCNRIANVLITQLSQLKDQILSAFMPDFIAINQFIRQKLDKNGQVQNFKHQFVLPSELQTSIIELGKKPQNLKNQHSLIMLISLFNRNDFDASNLTDELIQYFVQNVVQINLTCTHTNSVQQIDFIRTVAWFLFTLTIFRKDKSIFKPLKAYYPIFQAQPYETSFQFIALASELSTFSQLLPSQQFIRSLLGQNPTYSRRKQLIGFVVKLADNFLRYEQKINRFQKEENLNLAHDYLTFINARMKELSFPEKYKIQLISLLTSLIRSLSQETRTRLFQTKQLYEIMLQLFYRCQFGCKQNKFESLLCLSEIISCEQTLPQIIQIIGAQKLVHLLVESLNLPDNQLKMFMCHSINSLLQHDKQRFQALLERQRFLQVIAQLWQQMDQTQNQHASWQKVAASIGQSYFK